MSEKDDIKGTKMDIKAWKTAWDRVRLGAGLLQCALKHFLAFADEAWDIVLSVHKGVLLPGASEPVRTAADAAASLADGAKPA